MLNLGETTYTALKKCPLIKIYNPSTKKDLMNFLNYFLNIHTVFKKLVLMKDIQKLQVLLKAIHKKNLKKIA